MLIKNIYIINTRIQKKSMDIKKMWRSLCNQQIQKKKKKKVPDDDIYINLVSVSFKKFNR